MSKTALIIIDLQNDYFAGGRCELEGTDLAANQAAQLLGTFRQKNLPLIHIRHESPDPQAPFFIADTEGAQIHPSVQPLEGEAVVLKHHANSFRDTDLKQKLDDFAMDKLVICGAMSHMCVDASVRAASDLGYACDVVHDACATRAVEFDGISVSAQQVQAAYMAALSIGYARVMTTQQLISQLG